MPIASVVSMPYRLSLRQGWQSSRGCLGERTGWIIKLCSGSHRGYGDCAPLPGMGTETAEAAHFWLKQQLTRLRGKNPEAALASLPSAEHCPPAARCGVETALLDLCACRANQPLAQWLAPGATDSVRANASIGALDEHAAIRLRGAIGQGFAVLKIKVGLKGVDEELRVLKALASDLPPGVGLRLDANRAWSLDRAERFLEGLQGLPVEAVEEPLAEPNLNAWKSLQGIVPCPLVVDESLGLFTLEDWAGRGGVRRVVIKPMVVGGLCPAWSLAQAARQLGMESLVTTTVDSAVGVWAAVHLAAALPAGVEGVHGLATSRWLAEDIAEPPQVTEGVIHLGSGGGLGLQGEPVPESGSRE